MDTWIWVALAVGLIVLIAIAVGAVLARRSKAQVQDRFGPEYERTVQSEGGTRGAVKVLKERESRREQLDIKPLNPIAAERYRKGWHDAQARFVDQPQVALVEADQLIVAVMRERGYPMDDFDQRAADISVDHPQVVEHYRAAHDISQRTERGEADTEEMRRAMVHYRSLFEELLARGDEGSDDNRRVVRLDEEEQTRR